MATIYGQADEHGRLTGFEPTDPDLEVGRFGEGLDGAEVTLPDGRPGHVVKVYSYIQTGNSGSGQSNYVAVEIETDEED